MILLLIIDNQNCIYFWFHYFLLTKYNLRFIFAKKIIGMRKSVLLMLVLLQVSLILEAKQKFTKEGIEVYSTYAKNKIKNEYFNGSYIDFKVVYQKAGIYFSLLSKISKNSFNGPNTLELNCRGFSNSDNYYIKNKETKVNQIKSCYKSGNGKYYQYRPYQGIRKLKRFHFSTYFNVTDDVYHYELGTFSLRIDCGV